MTKVHLLASAATACLIAVPGYAQTSPATTPEPASAPVRAPASKPQSGGAALEEIVVTAQRKSERLQDVPISVNVVSGSQIAARGGTNSLDLVSLVPGLQFTRTGGGGTPFLRGVGTTNGDINIEPSVATYIDGVYIANNYANVSSLVNIDRIEVLKGPQGTLFGRNATGGVIQVITKDPTPNAYMDMALGYSSYDTIAGSIYATGAITDTLSGNIAIQGSHQGKGFGHNVVTGAETYKSTDVSVRGKLLWEPTDRLTVHLGGDYQYSKTGAGDFRLPKGVSGFDGVAFPNNRYDTRGQLLLDGGGEPFIRTEQFGGSLRLEYEADIGQFISISAYRKTYGVSAFDPDLTPVPVQEVSFPLHQNNVSQELQYISPKEWPVSVTAGVFYYRNTAGYKNGLVSGLGLDPNFSQIVTVPFSALQRSESIAGYVQADATILPKTKLTLGIRYTHERDSFDLNFAGQSLPAPNIGYDKPTWRVALDHAITPDIHVYASYNRGVKAGGYDLVDFSGTGTGFNPERLDAYEAGFKTELLARLIHQGCPEGLAGVA